MGNSSANACKIELEQDSFSAGETLRGALEFNIKSDADVSRIDLTLVGTERVRWVPTPSQLQVADGYINCVPDPQESFSGDDDTSMLDGHAIKQSPQNAPKQKVQEGHCDFFMRRILINSLRGLHRSGSSTRLPFQILLPADLEGSCGCSDSSFGLWRFYEIRARVGMNGNNGDLEYRVPVQVCELDNVFCRSPWTGAEAVANPEFRNMMGVSQGRFVISGTQDAPFYGQAENELQVRLELENLTCRDADHLQLELCQVLHLRNDRGRDFESDSVVEAWTRGGLKRNTMERGVHARELALTLSRDIAPQCIGLLAECTYYLRVRPHITRRDGCGPEVRIPICVQQPPIPAVQLPTPSAPPITAFRLLVEPLM
jgi:hypothetical protein